MVKRAVWLAGAALALPSAWLSAQQITAEPVVTAGEVVQPVASNSDNAVKSADGPAEKKEARVPGLPEGTRLPSIDELARMSEEELTERLGLNARADIPSAARRSLKQVGVLAMDEGGFSPGALAQQSAALVSAAIKGNKGPMVSRWGHILLRRALVSRLDTPGGMAPADFAAMRAALLVRMGEGEAARALVQDVDTVNYTPALNIAALDAYEATMDFTGICPAVTQFGDKGGGDDKRWTVMRGVCGAFRGEGQSALIQLDRLQKQNVLPSIDMLLAQKYAGAAGKARRAVKIEWDGIRDMNPWRFGMTLAVGLQPPASLMKDSPSRYDSTAAVAPMLGLTARAAAADRAAGAGVLSSAAMVDLYSQIFADEGITGEWEARATKLQNAYVAAKPADRLAAMKSLWEGAAGPLQAYSRQVLTAYAAARLPVSGDLAGDAGPVIASMLTAGLDRNALRWSDAVSSGSQGWALIALADPAARKVESGDVSSFYSDDDSEESRKTAFLVAGLYGLGRLDAETARSYGGKIGFDLDKPTRWSAAIDQAAEVGNPALVALLAGLGMQGDSWARMTPRHLYHIVAALNRVGLGAEARMIAAEAVARG